MINVYSKVYKTEIKNKQVKFAIVEIDGEFSLAFNFSRGDFLIAYSKEHPLKFEYDPDKVVDVEGDFSIKDALDTLAVFTSINVQGKEFNLLGDDISDEAIAGDMKNLTKSKVTTEVVFMR